jgi:hypothetical protein
VGNIKVNWWGYQGQLVGIARSSGGDIEVNKWGHLGQAVGISRSTGGGTSRSRQRGGASRSRSKRVGRVRALSNYPFFIDLTLGLMKMKILSKIKRVK